MVKSALLLIDIQDGLDQLDYYGGQRNNPNAESNCGKILDFFRNKNWPLFHIKHNSINENSPLHPSQIGNKIKKMVSPTGSEVVIEKSVNSAFIGTNLMELLVEQNISNVVLVGLTTEHCVSSTARMAANLGFKVTIVSDATAAFCKDGIKGEVYDADTIHLTTLATLKDEFAQILNTQTLLQEFKL